MDFFRLYSDLLINILPFLTYDLFITHFSRCVEKKKYYIIRAIFLLIWITCSIIPHIPYYSIIQPLLYVIYLILIIQNTWFKKVLVYLGYQLYNILATLVFVLIQSAVFQDFDIWDENRTYRFYVNLLCYFVIYTILYMYILFKKLSNFPMGKIYKRYFLVVISVMISLLTVCSIFIGREVLSLEDTAQLFFAILLMITFLSLAIYKKVVFVLEENMLSKIEIEKNALEKDYAIQIEEGLKKLSILRHDFKNHLIILQGYAGQERKEELLEYIQKLTEEFSSTILVDTPSQLLSSLINAKKADCERVNVSFDFQWDFESIHIPDFELVTIFGNMLDNALTAASKCKDGFIELKVLERGGYLEIDCINNHMEHIEKEDEHFVTTKTNQPELHGLGLISLRKTVAKLRGELDIDYTDEQFHMNMLIPNYK